MLVGGVEVAAEAGPPWGTKISHFVWEAGPPWYENFTLRVGGWIPREPRKNSHFVGRLDPP